MGDGIAAGFTSVDAAVRAAVAAQLQMPAVGLAVRMGVHTGEVERVGDDFRGRALNRAARIMATGHGGQILLSDVSAALVRNGPEPPGSSTSASTASATSSSPNGCGRSMHPDLPATFPLAPGAERTTTSLPAHRSPLVGRDETSASRRVARQERIVTLTGVGGVGKTRLAVRGAAELVRSVRACGSSTSPA